MLPFDLDGVSASDIAALISGKVPEGRTIEYKRELPPGGNDARKEFLADVTSFANGAGGAIIYGVSEERDGNGKSTGVPEAVVGLPNANLDAEKLRLEQWLRTGVAPRLPSYALTEVEVEPGLTVLVVSLKQSWLGPHMVTTSESRFYARGQAGKYALDVDQIRAAFVQTEEIPSRIRRLRDERLGLIASQETPVQLGPGGRVVLHLVPFSPAARLKAIDVHAWAKRSPPTLTGSLTGAHFNSDGHVGYTSEGARNSYVQFFRAGYIEAVNVCHHEYQGVPVLNIWNTEVEIVDGLSRYTSVLQEAGVDPPFCVLVSLVGVRGYGLVPSAMRDHRTVPFVAREVITLPDVLLEDLAAELPATLRPVFDALWQTFGKSRSFCFDQKGLWNRNFRW